MRVRESVVIAAVVAAAALARLDAQTIVIRDAGPGPVGKRIAAALAMPHRVIPPAATAALLARDSTYPGTVLVLGRDAIIEGRVHGDVFVIGGNAFVHPGANVEGRVVAIGGGAYGSRLAMIRDDLESHRDFTYDIARERDRFVLDYRTLIEHPTPVVSLPGAYGLRLPTYDRADGLSLPAGPLIALDTSRLEIEPIVTYRSQLGVIDPSVAARLYVTRRTEIDLTAERATYTNESWIWSDIVNSGSVLGFGNDVRNYYRADRAQLTLSHAVETVSSRFEPRIGVRVERDRSVRPDSAATGGPWSLFNRTSREHMLRPNPRATRGRLASALVGGSADWYGTGVSATANLQSELASFDVGSRRFAQSTFDGLVQFPTFGAQRFTLNTHLVYTVGDTAPPQRWSYFGGSGTLSTFDLLEFGGDELVYVESNYLVPLHHVDLPWLGSPSFTLRHAFGAAGIHHLPAFEQNVGLRVALSFLRLDLEIDPEHHKTEFGAGLSLTR